jgi:hypothetical protein
LIPLLIRKQRLAILWLGIGLLVIFLIAPTLWLEYLNSRILFRSVEFRPEENGSLTALFFLAGKWFGIAPSGPGSSGAAGPLAMGIFSLLLAGMAVGDWRRPRGDAAANESAGMVMYFPFMIAIPQLVYEYEGVLLIALIPVLCHAWFRSPERVARIWLLLMAFGIALTQIQIAALDRLLGAGRADAFPGFGLLLILIGGVGYTFLLNWKPSAQNTDPAMSAAPANTP